jgi:hypothetical protein
LELAPNINKNSKDKFKHPLESFDVCEGCGQSPWKCDCELHHTSRRDTKLIRGIKKLETKLKNKYSTKDDRARQDHLVNAYEGMKKELEREKADKEDYRMRLANVMDEAEGYKGEIQEFLTHRSLVRDSLHKTTDQRDLYKNLLIGIALVALLLLPMSFLAGKHAGSEDMTDLVLKLIRTKSGSTTGHGINSSREPGSIVLGASDK